MIARRRIIQQTPNHRLRLSTTDRRPSAPRRGTAMIVAIVCLTLMTAITVSLAKLAIASQQQVEREQWRLQSAWLAESGLLRAVTRFHASGDAPSEEWTPTNIGPSGHNGRVTIKVAADPEDDTRLTITATADFPDHPTDRVRTTRTRTIQTRGAGFQPADGTERQAG